MDTPEEIRTFLIDSFKKHVPPLQINKDNPSVFEVGGTKPVMQGKQKVDGHYVGSVVLKPKDTRLYFFPIYTHPHAFLSISPELRKCLHGKSCFHFKKTSIELRKEIESMIGQGVSLYIDAGLI